MIAPMGAIVVPASGTPVHVIDELTPPPANLPANRSIHGVMFQALPQNTGIVYVGRGANMIRVLPYTAVMAFLAIPTVNFLPTFSAALTIAPNGLALQDFWLDVDVSGDGALVTYLVT